LGQAHRLPLKFGIIDLAFFNHYFLLGLVYLFFYCPPNQGNFIHKKQGLKDYNPRSPRM
jgi:hypothetical protein